MSERDFSLNHSVVLAHRAGVLDALVRDAPGDGRARGGLAHVEVDDGRRVAMDAHPVILLEDPERDAQASLLDPEMPREVARCAALYKVIRPQSLGEDLNAPEQIARGERVPDALRRERNAQRRRSGPPRLDTDRAPEDRRVSRGGERVAPARAALTAVVGHGGHMAAGAARIGVR